MKQNKNNKNKNEESTSQLWTMLCSLKYMKLQFLELGKRERIGKKKKKDEIIVKNYINMAKTINPYIQEVQLTPSPKHCGI